MGCIDHPDYHYENRKLKKALDLIARETTLTTRLEREQAKEVDILRKQSGGDFMMELFVKETIYRHTVQTLRNLKLAKHKPYFTRIDFLEKGKSDIARYYIGKYGVFNSNTQEPEIIDWRSPIANLYYSGQVGPMQIQTPEGILKGELLLKRQFGIQNGELQTIFDTEVVSQDVYLQSILGSHADDRLKDIVTTIQKEQNDIIRAPREKPLIVQGVAGSGKTTIALHRIAYLLYTYQDVLAPENMMILAPNPLFLDYISEVLPELGVENVLQTTFEGLAARLLKRKLPKIDESSKLLILLQDAVPQQEKEDIVAVSQLKGSLRFKALLDQYLYWLERHIVPHQDVRLGPIRIYSYEEMQRFFLEDLSPFPYAKRITEVRKHMTRKSKDAAQRLIHLIERECESRAVTIKKRMPDCEERRERLTHLYDSRDARVKEAEKLQKTFVEKYMALWPDLDLLACYEQFFLMDSLSSTVSEELWSKVSTHSLALLHKGEIETEDLAPLVYLSSKIHGLSEKLQIHHTVLDEAQDFSDFQLDLLKSLTGNSSFTIVGDLSQGIHSYRGIQNWKETMDNVFPDDEPNYRALVQSYRNTIEIMDFANKVIAKSLYPGQVLAKPVLRHGEKPAVIQKSTEKEVLSAIKDKIEDLLKEEYKTIAVIHKTPEGCQKLYQQLRKKIKAPVQLLTPKETRYKGGIMVIPSYLAKGLEFDAVIMADVSEKSFGLSQLDARLLYVCLTRPLHRLYCYYTGRISPLLE